MMQLMNHYYSVMSGLAAALGSFFGKLITFSFDDESVNVEKMLTVWCTFQCCMRHYAMPYYISRCVAWCPNVNLVNPAFK